MEVRLSGHSVPWHISFMNSSCLNCHTVATQTVNMNYESWVTLLSGEEA
jgi:hypothetical protein